MYSSSGDRIPSLTGIGLRLGFQAGLVASWLYLTGFVALIFGPGALLSVWRVDLEDLGRALLLLGWIFVVGGIIGMLPAAVIGTGTGWLLAYLIDRRLTHATRTQIILASMSVCIGIALVISVMFVFMLQVSDIEVYLIFIGFPALLFIAMGGFVGDRLYRKRLDLLQLQERAARMAARRAASMPRGEA